MSTSEIPPAALTSPPMSPDDEVEALADPDETSLLPRERKSSLTPSEEALLIPGLRQSVTSPRRRPSVDSHSTGSGTSGGRSGRSAGHSYATAKNYFPLVQKTATTNAEALTPSNAGSDSPRAVASASPASPRAETPASAQQARRRPSGSSSLASSTRPTSVFPTVKPSRSAGSNVFPLRSPSDGPAVNTPSSRSSDSASIRSGAASGVPSPPPSIQPSPPPSRSATSPSLFSRVDSLYAPSVAPSSRSAETTATSRRPLKPLVKPSYTGSLAPSHAEAFYASAAEPMPGPPSIFLNPTPQQRSVKELLPLPKKRLSSFFGGIGSKSKSSSPSKPSDPASSAAPRPPGAPAAPTRRGKSASILDAALASSATWAAHRGEQSRSASSSSHAGGAFSPGPFGAGPPAGYRPAHQVRRQREEAEAAARAAAAAGAGAGAGPTMGGGGEVPVSGEAIAEAFTRNQGRVPLPPSSAGGGDALVRSQSDASLASVADLAQPASKGGGGAFPVRREAFPIRREMSSNNAMGESEPAR